MFPRKDELTRSQVKNTVRHASEEESRCGSELEDLMGSTMPVGKDPVMEFSRTSYDIFRCLSLRPRNVRDSSILSCSR